VVADVELDPGLPDRRLAAFVDLAPGGRLPARPDQRARDHVREHEGEADAGEDQDVEVVEVHRSAPRRGPRELVTSPAARARRAGAVERPPPRGAGSAASRPPGEATEPRGAPSPGALRRMGWRRV